MSCEDFEMLMADALGGELAESDRAQFEGHLAFCGVCREEYQSMIGAVDRMRTLPGSSRVSEGVAHAAHALDSSDDSQYRRMWAGRVLRYAASALLAFGAGYAFRGELGVVSPADAPVVTQPAGDEGATLETALVSAHQAKPGRSRLSAAMIAMFSGD